MAKLVECVPNFSEGRDLTVIEKITAEIKTVPGVTLLDVDPGVGAMSVATDGTATVTFDTIERASYARVAGAIDREADGPTRNITVRATSTDTSFTTRTFTIAVGDVDEFDTGAVTDVDATANAVDENAVVGTTLGITIDRTSSRILSVSTSSECCVETTIV